MKYTENCILIIDDDEQILGMLADYFKTLDYRVLTAYDAEAAIKTLGEDKNISIVLTDITLPGMSGIELLKIAHETHPDIPVVIITGQKILEFAISAVKHGAQDYITKPFQLVDVRKIVEKVLRYRRTYQKKQQVFQYAKSMNIDFEVETKELDAGVLSNYLAKFLLNSGFCSKEEYHQYYVAFMETLINSIEHGNLELHSSLKGDTFEQIAQFEELRTARLEDPKYSDRKIKVTFMFNPKCFSLTISDEGPGFNWKKQFGDKDEINTESYGRGFVLIKHVIDEVYFNDSGNSITLVKSNE